MATATAKALQTTSQSLRDRLRSRDSKPCELTRETQRDIEKDQNATNLTLSQLMSRLGVSVDETGEIPIVQQDAEG